MSTEADCLFCKIVAGEIPCRKVYEDAETLAFLDIAPWGLGHTLVIPKRHVASALSEPGALAEVAPAVGTIAALLVDKLDADGANILSNAGAASGQEVFHLHVHIIPRFNSSPGIENIRSHPSVDLDEVHARIIG